jgi:hypothetical protein
VQKRSVGQHLRHHGPPGLGVAGKLDLDDRHPTRPLNGHEVRVTASQRNLAADDHHLRGAGQGQQLRRLLHQLMKRRLIEKATRDQQPPAGAVVTPQCRHAKRSLSRKEQDPLSRAPTLRSAA